MIVLPPFQAEEVFASMPSLLVFRSYMTNGLFMFIDCSLAFLGFIFNGIFNSKKYLYK